MYYTLISDNAQYVHLLFVSHACIVDFSEQLVQSALGKPFIQKLSQQISSGIMFINYIDY